VRVRSRILIGAGAWLLGAAMATAGSMYAVDQLGQGLIDQHSKQVTVAMVNAELALERSARTPSAGHTDSPGQKGSQAPQSPQAHQTRRAGSHAPTPPPTPTPSPAADASELLISAAGTAVANCEPAGAYLVSWSPQQGFEAFHVLRGPARQAVVTFADPSGGVRMRVTCSGDIPVAHMRKFTWGNGTRHGH
jgi:hypothetical protein